MISKKQHYVFLYLLFSFFLMGSPEEVYLDSLGRIDAKCDTNVARKYFLKGKELRKDNQLDSGKIYIEEAYKIYKKCAIAVKITDCINQLTIIARFQNRYPFAKYLIESALKISEDGNIRTLPSTGDIYWQLGWYHLNTSSPKDAVTYLTHSLEIYKTFYKRENIKTARSYLGLAAAYYWLKDYNQTLFYYKKSVVLHEKEPEPNFPKIASIYSDIGTTYTDLGRYNESLQYLEHALKVLVDHYQNNKHSRLATIYSSLGRTYRFLGHYDKATNYYHKALSVFRSLYGDEHPATATTHNRIARLHVYQGEYQKALEIYTRSITIFDKFYKKGNRYTAETYFHLGLLYFYKKEFSTALTNFNKSITSYQEIYGNDYLILGILNNHIGLTYLEMENWKLAEQHFKAGLAINEKKYGSKHRQISQGYRGLGEALAAMGNYDAGLFNIQKSIVQSLVDFDNFDYFSNPDLSENIIHRENLLDALNSKTQILFHWANQVNLSSKDKIKRLKIGLKTCKIGKDLIFHIHEEIKGDLSKINLSNKSFEIFNYGILICDQLLSLTGEKFYLEYAFQFSEYNRANILAESLRESEARNFANIPDSLLAEERKLRTKLASNLVQLQKVSEQKNTLDNLKIHTLQEEKFVLDESYQRLVKELETGYPDYYNLKYRLKPVSIKDVQAALNTENAMIEYFVGEKEIRLFLITEKEFLIKRFPNDSIFQELLSGFNKSIRKDTEAKYFAERSIMLYNKLIRPIASKIARKKRLIIIPDGELHYLPFEALIKSMPEKKLDFPKMAYLLHDFEFSYHYSANLYLYSQGQEVPKYMDNAGVFAPVFKPGDNTGQINQSGESILVQVKEQAEALLGTVFRSNGPHLKELPYSEVEAQGILDALDWDAQKNASYIKREATEERFKRDVHKYKYVHLATHSFVNEMRPKLSGIAFAQPQDTNAAEDGILYADEIYNLDMNADLVTLSSCESGIGKLIRGEGLMAMTRGFLYAGATNVVVSLWKVADQPTSELMIEFYKQIADEKPYPTALRTAKLKLIKNTRTAFPAFWSSFVLIGR